MKMVRILLIILTIACILSVCSAIAGFLFTNYYVCQLYPCTPEENFSLTIEFSVYFLMWFLLPVAVFAMFSKPISQHFKTTRVND